MHVFSKLLGSAHEPTLGMLFITLPVSNWPPPADAQRPQGYDVRRLPQAYLGKDFASRQKVAW